MKTTGIATNIHPNINPERQAMPIDKINPTPTRIESGGIPGARKLKASTGVMYARV
jgi:hypothetical protein